MKSIKNTEKKLSLSKLNKTNKNYDVKTFGCTCSPSYTVNSTHRSR